MNGATADTNVGIGTTTPISRLHVVGDTNISGNLLFSGNLQGNGGQLTNLNGASVTGTLPVATIPSGSVHYIQNQNASAQASANFNISGNGTAGGTLSGGIVNAATQFNLGNNRILHNTGGGNLFAGIGAGAAATINNGGANSFFGYESGLNNTACCNSFFGN